MIKRVNKKQGVAILFAVLMVSVILSISLVLFNITFKQLILSSTIRESQLAFYAADSALNCARHWNSFHSLANNPFGFFADNGTGTLEFQSPTKDKFDCGDNNPVPVEWDLVGTKLTSRFTLQFAFAGRTTCAKVAVTKDKASPTLSTLIEAQGYNVVDCSDLSGKRTVERAIRFGPF